MSIILIIVIASIVILGAILTICAFGVFYMWLMQDFIERDMRNGKLKWLRKVD